MTGPTGVLIVGVGFIADAHVAALAASPRAALVGVVDADPARAQAFSHAHGGVRWTADLAQGLAWDDVDAVIVCTPNHTHAPIGAQVAATGKHLLMEKPLATTVADATMLVEAFGAVGRVVMAAHTHRAYDYARTVKNALDAGAVGRPELVRLAILGGWIWPDWNAWVIDPRRSGGHALHNGVHLLDLVCWWLGADPLSITARGRKQTAGELGIHDYLEMVLRFEGGVTAICEMSRAHRPGSLGHRDVLVIGRDGVLRHEWDAEASLLIGESGTAAVPAAGNDGFAVQLEAWLDAVDGGVPTITGQDAVRAVAMGVAAEVSIATGEPVAIADTLRGAVTA